ncbi:MAG: hypothetical protein R3F59_34515 [Myxococcota bacterium]
MRLDDAPEGLDVVLDERLHVELGPPPARRLWVQAAGLAAVGGATALLGTVSVAGGVVAAAIGTAAVVVERGYAFWRTEAALRLSWDDRALALERHFRARRLWRRVLPWREVAGAERAGDALRLRLADGSALTFGARFRTAAQLDWVAAQLTAAAALHREGAVEAAPEQRAALRRLIAGARSDTRRT